jgi:hypothetical protein
MFQKNDHENLIRKWMWPIILVAVLLLFATIQILHVNTPRPSASTPPSDLDAYTTPGSLVSGNLVIPPGDFYSTKINLNRRARLSGTFRTSSLKSFVSVLVLDQDNYDKWKMSAPHEAVTETGFVPGGKLSPLLEAGTYFLIIDNRASGESRSLSADFRLE